MSDGQTWPVSAFSVGVWQSAWLLSRNKGRGGGGVQNVEYSVLTANVGQLAN